MAANLENLVVKEACLHLLLKELKSALTRKLHVTAVTHLALSWGLVALTKVLTQLHLSGRHIPLVGPSRFSWCPVVQRWQIHRSHIASSPPQLPKRGRFCSGPCWDSFLLLPAFILPLFLQTSLTDQTSHVLSPGEICLSVSEAGMTKRANTRP